MIHGGDVYSEGLLKGVELIDFSSNINPLGVPKSFLDNMNKAVEALVRYPDIEYRKLIESLNFYLRETYKVSYLTQDNFLLGNGASEVIDLCIGCSKKVLILTPSFLEYELSAVKARCEILYSSLDENMDYDYKDIKNKLSQVDSLIIGNPNNPNGGILDKDKFKEILNYCDKNKKTVVVDEAFIEFTGHREHSAIKEIEKYNCLIIIKAITKFFAMPGIRFGYGISSNKSLITQLKAKQNPWNINCFAEIAAMYALKDKEYIASSIKWIEEERRFLELELSKLKCISRVYKTHANFILCKLKDIDCNTLYERCLKKQILIRRASNFKGLGENFVRFAVKDRKNNKSLINALENI